MSCSDYSYSKSPPLLKVDWTSGARGGREGGSNEKLACYQSQQPQLVPVARHSCWTQILLGETTASRTFDFFCSFLVIQFNEKGIHLSALINCGRKLIIWKRTIFRCESAFYVLCPYQMCLSCIASIVCHIILQETDITFSSEFSFWHWVRIVVPSFGLMGYCCLSYRSPRRTSCRHVTRAYYRRCNNL